ncbi:MAG: VanW family protein [Deltaproteobacteria bacterium]|nr:VanW family protein [Deltaproteobacteria bacterium]
MSGHERHKFLTRATIGLTVLGLSLTATAAWWSAKPTRVVRSVAVWGFDAGGLSRDDLRQKLASKAAAFRAKRLTVKGVEKTWHPTRAQLGLDVDVDTMVRAALRVGHSADPWQNLVDRQRALDGRFHFGAAVKVDRGRLLAFLQGLRSEIDRPAIPPAMDLRRRQVTPGQQATRLAVYDSAAAIVLAGMDHSDSVRLVIHSGARNKPIAHLNITTVMGWYETPYKFTGKYANRAHNLKLAARKINGFIMMPGQEFSFNEVVGPRSEREGYHVAPVISKGEMVDGMAGGACQISSTLFAAAFFAGLDIEEADVHSQPSHYIDLGLDATVVWPDKGLKLRNPYDFPVIIHEEVAFGRVRTEILGPKRPFKIGFERSIVRQRPYRQVVRPDPTMERGTRKIEQRGEFGYTVRRRRIFFDKQGVEVKSQYWTVAYPPTTLIIRMGTKPPEDPNKILPELKPIPPKPTPKRFHRIIQ